jgi:Holliday junction resolvase RusA-like endonuclease
MTHIKFDIRPYPKQRPRFANGHTYTPNTTKAYETTIAQEYALKRMKKHEGTLSVYIIFRYRIPPVKAKKVKIGEPCHIKGDVDNLIKSVLDALNGIAYTDDSQITKVSAEKVYAERDCVEVMIFEKGDEQ